MNKETRDRQFSLDTIFLYATYVGVLAIYILAPIFALRWARQPFVGVLLEHTLVVGAVEERWAGARVDLKNPDRLVAVNGRAVHRQHDLEQVLGSLTVDDVVTLTVETSTTDGGWALREVQLPLENLALLDLIIHFLIPYLVGLVYLGTGAWIFYRQPARRQSRLFALLCVLGSTILVTIFDASTTHHLIRLWTAALALTGALVVYLGFTFLPQQGSSRRFRWVRLLPLIAAGLIVIWGQARLYGPDPRSYFGPRLAASIFLATGVFSFVAMLGYTRLRPSFTQARLQAQIMLLGTALAFVPTALWAAASALGRLIPAIGSFYLFHPLINFTALILFPLTAGYAIDRYQSLDVDLLVTPHYHDRKRYLGLIRDFGRKLAVSLDLDYILDQLLSYVGAMFRPRHALVFMVRQSDHYELHAAWGSVNASALHAVHFTLHDRVISKLQRDGESLPLTPEAVQSLRLGDEEQARLECLGAVLLVPLRAKEHLLGVLALGALESGDTYPPDNVALLTMMADQAAVTAQNAILYGQQVEQERRLVQQTRRLTDILALGNQLKSLDRDLVVQSTVEAVRSSLGFELVTLSLVKEDEPTRVRVVAWAGLHSTAWERLGSTSFPLMDFDALEGVHKLGHCYFIHAPGVPHGMSTFQQQVSWHEGDQLFVPLTTSEGLFGYLTVDRPESGMRPTEETLEVLEIFANQAAIAVQNANLYASIDRALDERVAELATLQEIDRQINVKLDFNYVMSMTLEWAMRITLAIAGTLALVSSNRKTLHVVAHQGYPKELDRYWSVPWPIDGEGDKELISRVVRTGKPMMNRDVTQDASYVDATISTRSHLVVPITREDQVIGVINLESAEPDGFSPDDLAFLMRLADHATIAIENAILYRQADRRVAELSALQQISLDLTSSLNLSAVLDSIAANTLSLTQADQITIYLYDEHKDALFFGTGLSPSGKQERPPIPIHQNRLTATVARQGESTVIDDTREHPLLADVDWQVGAIASIPLCKASHVLGVFDLAFSQAHPFAEDELRVLNLLADQAAIAIENAQLYADVQRANDAKSEFVSTVSREFRVPMTSIQGYARLMDLSPVQAEQQQEFAEVILRNIERMNKLVSDLLDLSRIESGRMSVVPRPVEVSAVARDALRSLEEKIEAREYELIVDIPDDLPAVHIDPALIARAWESLLDNAYRYTLPGGQITVRARQRDDLEMDVRSGRWIECTVKDTGIGIPPQDHERIFEQFYRGHRSEPDQEPGTGLGLSITKSIVELHGGHIWVESAPGLGSTFYFTLPIAP